MSTSTAARPQVPIIPEPASEAHATTLLELVRAVSEVTPDDQEVIATVLHMLRSGRVYLTGNFAGQTLEIEPD